ncbi:MAG: hypothetical protein IJ920_00865 [Paludibacteraceae bacterium]|nr:hypothetical protein [Paludibacteraceae bacterium]
MKLNGDYIQDMAELQQYDCYSWGEDLIHVTEPNGDEYIVNKVTGKARKIVEARHLVGFSDDDIDFATIDQLPNSHNAHTRRIDYAAVNRWTNCKNGIFALYWMLYPDGRYFADEDGFGMEDNDELSVCCIMNDNLEVLRPFTVVPDVRALLDQMIHEHHL